jgi:hypothetical protein
MRQFTLGLLVAGFLLPSTRAFADDVTILFDGRSGVAQDVNAGGQIVGILERFTVFAIRGGKIQGFEMPGEVISVGNNDRGEIVGTYLRGQEFVGFLIDRTGAVHDLAIPGLVRVIVEDIDTRGAIVGWYFDEFSSTTPIHGFVYADGVVETLDNPFGFPVTAATGIANDGTIVGYFGGTFDDPKRAFLLRHGDWTAPLPGDESFLFDVEASGAMVGSWNGGAGLLVLHGKVVTDLPEGFIPRGVSPSGRLLVGEIGGAAAVVRR